MEAKGNRVRSRATVVTAMRIMAVNDPEKEQRVAVRLTLIARWGRCSTRNESMVVMVIAMDSCWGMRELGLWAIKQVMSCLHPDQFNSATPGLGPVVVVTLIHVLLIGNIDVR